MSNSRDAATIILAKGPFRKTVKTRIAESTTPAFAQAIAEASLEDLLHNIGGSEKYDLIIGTDSIDDLRWFKEQLGVNGIAIPESLNRGLSYLIEFSFDVLFNRYAYKKALLIPMDMPFLTTNELHSCFQLLETYTYVLGPEHNGGVYLIGLRQDGFHTGLFNDVLWSTPQSYESLRRNLEENPILSLQPKTDLNTLSDLLNCRDLIRSSCPKLYSVLEKPNPLPNTSFKAES